MNSFCFIFILFFGIVVQHYFISAFAGSFIFYFFAGSVVSFLFLLFSIGGGAFTKSKKKRKTFELDCFLVVSLNNANVCNRDSTSPSKILRWIFTSTKPFPPGVISTFKFSMVFKLYDFVGYLVHFETVYYLVLWDNIVFPFVVNSRHIYSFSSRFALLGVVLINVW